jgi:sugar/nucleoside kinase (ribokinase family)
MGAILGIGGVTVDRVAVVPRMPGWDEVEYVSRYEVRQGGMVATAMMTVARLGGKAEFIGGIGDDMAGHFVFDAFLRGGVRAERVKVFPGGSTPQSIVLVHESTAERTILHHRGVQENSTLEGGDILLNGVEYLHLDGYWFDTALLTAREARRLGITVTVDPSTSISSAKAESLFPLADYIMPSEKYARRFTGKDDLRTAAHMLLEYGGKAVVITMGGEGCLVMTPDGDEHIPAFSVRVTDTTGAGDAFHGGFIFALSEGKDLHEAARFASAVAALKCSSPGKDGLPTREEVERLLALYS